MLQNAAGDDQAQSDFHHKPESHTTEHSDELTFDSHKVCMLVALHGPSLRSVASECEKTCGSDLVVSAKALKGGITTLENYQREVDAFSEPLGFVAGKTLVTKMLVNLRNHLCATRDIL